MMVRVHLSLLLLILAASATDARDLSALAAAEDALSDLAASVASVYAHQKCTLAANCDCSFSALLSTLSSTQCLSYISDSAVCGTCDIAMGTLQSSVVLGADNATSAGAAEEVCWTAAAAANLAAMHANASSAAVAGLWQWLAVGTQSGVARIVPAVAMAPPLAAQDAAPWFAGAAAGPKDVVVLLDRSNSMGYNDDAWSVAKTLVHRMLASGLSLADFFAVYAVNDKPKRLGTVFDSEYVKKNGESVLLERATADAVFRVRSEICALDPRSGSILSRAFAAAGTALVSSHTSNVSSSSGCDAHIVLITDGDIRERAAVVTSAVQNVAASLAAAAPGRALHVHTYAIGKYVRPWLRQLSCVHNGVAVELSADTYEDEASAAAMRWLEFATADRTVARYKGTPAAAQRVASWTDERYLTTTEKGAVVSMPVYATLDGSGASHDHLVGVVAGSVFLGSFEHNLTGNPAYPESYELDGFHTLMLYREKNASMMCHSATLSVQQMQQWRQFNLGYQCTYEDMGMGSNASQADQPYLPEDPTADTWVPSEPACSVLSRNASQLWCNTGAANFTFEEQQQAHCCQISGSSCAFGNHTDLTPKTVDELDFELTCPSSIPAAGMATLLLALMELSVLNAL